MHHENDVLYQIFVEASGQDVKFMRIWLDLFVKMHEKSFEQRGKEYFRSKGLTFSCWAESILDNRKADIMGLYSFCMLTEVHAWIHLHDGQIRTMLDDDKLTHDTAMERCEIHLAYLGQGLYVSLHAHKLKMRTVTEQSLAMDVKPVVIGELTSNESSTLDKLIKFGLRVGIVKIKEEIESDTELDKSSAQHTLTGNKDKGPQYQIEKFNLKVCVIKVPDLKLKEKGPFKLTLEFLKEHM